MPVVSTPSSSPAPANRSGVGLVLAVGVCAVFSAWLLMSTSSGSPEVKRKPPQTKAGSSTSKSSNAT